MAGRTLTAYEFLFAVLRDDTRHRILAGKTLPRLRDGMRSGVFAAGVHSVRFDKIIKAAESKNEQDGFHVLHDWDGKADKLNDEIIPVDVLNYILRANLPAQLQQNALAILLDYFFLYVLALHSVRVWDEGDPNANLDNLTQLLQDLQGPSGSGQQFAENAETLMLIATSHFEPDVKAYERLLERVKTLDPSHQLRIALAHAAILSSHLRHGFQGIYGRDIAKMREDNAPDYAWLRFALLTLMKAYVQGPERERIVEGLLNGLSPDARAFVGKAPVSLEFVELLNRSREDLFQEFERHRPSEGSYSPMSFTFNFPHNLLKAVVVDAILRGKGWTLTLNDMLSAIPRLEPIDASRRRLAGTLSEYARSSPEIVRGRPVPAVNYDPRYGLLNFAKTIQIVQESCKRV